jgi:P-loop containing dynein motor region D4
VIDWFFPWPADALQKVAEFFLLEEQLPPTQRKAVVEHLVHAHETITTAASQFCLELRRHYYVTPKNYLDFITNYKTQLSYNRKRIDQSTKRLQGGLQKLIEAAEAVDSMQVCVCVCVCVCVYICVHSVCIHVLPSMKNLSVRIHIKYKLYCFQTICSDANMKLKRIE